MILNLTDVFLPLLLDWIAKGFFVLGFAYLTDRLLHRSSASLRHSIWLIGLSAVLLIPGISLVIPQLNIPVLRLDMFSAGQTAAAGASNAAAPSAIGWSAADTFLVGYLATALFVFIWQLIGRAYAFLLRNRSAKITDARITGELRHLQAVLGVTDRVQLMCSDQISIPFSTGYLRPAIVLPEAAYSWSQSVLGTILIHELAHIKRRDILTRMAAQISCCVHWINPLAWYGFGRMIMEQEIACDNQVLVSGTKASDYARNLLAIAKVRTGSLDFALTALGRRAELQQRLLEILNPSRSRTPLRSGGSLILLIFAMGLLLPVSALNLWNRSAAADFQKPSIETKPPVRMEQKPGQAAGTPNPVLEPLPDLDTAKKELERKLQDMKAQGVPEAELKKFSADSKAKLQNLQKQIQKQEEIRKQMENKNSPKEGKGGTV